MPLVKILLPDLGGSLMQFSVKSACMYVCVYVLLTFKRRRKIFSNLLCKVLPLFWVLGQKKKKIRSMDEEHLEQAFQLSLFSLNILNTINASSGNYYNIFRAEKSL